MCFVPGCWSSNTAAAIAGTTTASRGRGVHIGDAGVHVVIIILLCNLIHRRGFGGDGQYTRLVGGSSRGGGGLTLAILHASSDGRGGRSGFVIFQFINGSEDCRLVRHDSMNGDDDGGGSIQDLSRCRNGGISRYQCIR